MKKLLYILLLIPSLCFGQLTYDTTYYATSVGGVPVLQNNKPIRSYIIDTVGIDTSGMDLWLIAESQYLTISNDSVSEWDDKFNRYTVSQSDVTKQPIFNDTVIFDGVNDYLANGFTFNNRKSFTVIYKAEKKSGNSLNVVGEGNVNQNRVAVTDAVSDEVFFLTPGTGGGNGISVPSEEGYNSVICLFDGNEAGFDKYRIYINGILKDWDITTYGAPNDSVYGITQNFSVGRTYGNGWKYGEGNISDIKIYDHALSNIEIDNLYGLNVVCDGNSLVAGVGATISYPDYLRATGNYFKVYNLGIGGQTFREMIDDTPADDSLSLTTNVLVAWEIPNSLYYSESVDTVINTMIEYGQDRQAAGWDVYMITCIPCAGGIPAWGNEAYNDSIDYINDYLKTNYADFSDGYIDVRTNPNLTDTDNKTYYNEDGTHLTNAGYNEVARMVDEYLETKYRKYR